MVRRGTGPGSALAWACALVLVAAGCTVNPSPEPPTLNPDLMRMDEMDCTPGECVPGDVVLRGMPGAAAPGSDLWIVNLSSEDPPTLIPVVSDGSFLGSVSGLKSDAYRIQARAEGLRSPPVDVAIDPDGLLLPATSDAGCAFLSALEIEVPTTPVDGRGEGTVVISNGCSSTVTVITRLRAPSDAFAPDAAPDPLAAGADGTVRVFFTPPSSGLHEEILFINLDTARIAVTLLGEGS